MPCYIRLSGRSMTVIGQGIMEIQLVDNDNA